MILGLFKNKLNEEDHKHVINYIVTEEANQQWIYHVLENNFNKESFRCLPFAKNVLNSFVTMNLNMKASDQMLNTMADLGFRKCREWLDEYFVLEKKLTKLKFIDLHKSAGKYIFYASKMEERYPDMVFNPNKFKGMNSIQLNSYFEDRNLNYNIMMQIQREVNCHVKTLASKKEYTKLSGPEKDKLADKELDKYNKLVKNKQEDVLLKLEKDAEKIFKKRNLFNEIGH